MIKSVEVLPWCIWCRNCENVCPKIFKVEWTSKVISHDYVGNETEILMAEAMCPVKVIKVEKEWNFTLTFKEAKLLDKKYLTSDIIELVLEKPKNFTFKPWQYVSLMFEDWKWKFSRQYSIAFDDEKTFTLTIRIGEKWRWAAQIKKLKIWKNIKFLWALWHFYLQNNKKEKYFISTGTWLAPFIAMGKHCDENVKKHFIIWWRKREDFYYAEHLAEIKNADIHYFASQQEADEKCKKWRVTDFLPNISKENSEVYLCWNPEMIKSVIEWLKKLWYDEKNIFSEWFTASGKNVWVLKEIFVNWNIPFVKEISWWIIIFAFVLASLFAYKIGNETNYDDFLFFWNFNSFMFSISWWSVVFVMLIRPISDIFSKNNFLRKLKNFRKPLWILSSILIIVNFAWSWIFDPSLIVDYFTTIWRWNNLTALLARTSEITAVLLFLTSNLFSQKLLGKNWKRLQYLSYPYFITWAIAWVSYTDTTWAYFQYYWLVWVWVILWIIAFIKSHWKIKK